MEGTAVWMIVRVVLILAALGVAVILTGLVLNRPPLFDAPGIGVRLKTYFTTHTAELRDGHAFPELRLRRDARAPEVLLADAKRAVQMLGWTLEQNGDAGSLHAVVTSRLWRFKDDVYITVRGDARGSELYIRSESRVGRGDLAANERHVLDLLAAMNVN